MASKTTLNAKNLEALGTERLAELLIALSKGDAAAKRRLRLELVAVQSPADIGREVRKRIGQIAKSRAFVDWHKVKTLADDLDTQRRTIVDQVAKHDAAEALDLLWRFLELAESVFARCDDSNGAVISVFHAACEDLGDIAKTAAPESDRLADRVFEALNANDYGQCDNLIPILAPALGATGLKHLKERMVALSTTPIEKPADADRTVVGWSMNGPLYEDELAEHARDSTVRMALQDIADAEGDVDAFLAQYDAQTRRVPTIAAEIAARLLAAGRADDAWKAIEATENKRPDSPLLAWEDVRIEVLEALDRKDEAQAARRSCFERFLSAPHLKAYLKGFPDFDDIAEEEKALDHAERTPDLLHAVWFLITWPALDRAARLIVRRSGELDGNHYEILTPAADALAARYPLAATLTLRAMIDFTLTKARSSRYRHAARHLLECQSLAAGIDDFGTVETHDAYVDRLKAEHGRKASFWTLIY